MVSASNTYASKGTQARLKELYEKRDALLEESEAIIQLPKRENRVLTEAEGIRFNQIVDEKQGELVTIAEEIRKVELQQERDRAFALATHRARSEYELQAITEGELPEEGDRMVTARKNAPTEVKHKMASFRAFSNNEDGAKDAFLVGHWFRAINARGKNTVDQRAEEILNQRGYSIQLAQTEGSDTAGGYLVPRPLSSAIIDIREKVGVARRLADVVPMSSKTEDVPKRTGGLTVYYPGEGNTVTTSDMTFGRVNLVAIKRAVANQISSEVSEDALVNMTDRAVEEMGYALADKEDAEYINGDGTSDYGGEVGLLNALGSAGIYTAATGQSTWQSITQETLSLWKALLPSRFYRKDEMAVLCSSQFYFSVFDRQMAGAGGNSNRDLRMGILGELADAMWDGYPVVFTDKMPTSTSNSTVSALFGNFRLSSMFGDRTGTRIGMSTDYAFLDDVTTLLATSRYDINIHEPGDDTNAGGYVGLSTSAS